MIISALLFDRVYIVFLILESPIPQSKTEHSIFDEDANRRLSSILSLCCFYPPDQFRSIFSDTPSHVLLNFFTRPLTVPSRNN
mmetsp:Transcript_32719/g.65122  ORF Transcript_32719/g.65122 Transcript_32719/m.65122 type:complete len:83 (-) Transcript_32719:648-896(-)